MCRFIESICFDQIYHHLDLHQERINRTFREYYPNSVPFLLSEILRGDLQGVKKKVRVLYSDKDWEVESIPYQKRYISAIKTICADRIDYSYKYADRRYLDELFALRERCDDIIIIRDGFITDSYYANLVFWNGQDWVTPSTYLLNGVKRQWLIKSRQVKVEEISLENIKAYEKVSLINALLDPGEIEVAIDAVK